MTLASKSIIYPIRQIRQIRQVCNLIACCFPTIEAVYKSGPGTAGLCVKRWSFFALTSQDHDRTYHRATANLFQSGSFINLSKQLSSTPTKTSSPPSGSSGRTTCSPLMTPTEWALTAWMFPPSL